MSNKYIAVSYRLYVDGDNGKELVEEAPVEQPFYFISGFGAALDAFEKQLLPLAKGDTFSFTLSKEEAYGDYEEAHVIDLDRDIFCINGHFDHEHIYPDAIVPLQNEDGNRFQGRIVTVGEEKVKVDLNHPLAGEALHFEGTVVEHRDATNSEIQTFVGHLSGEGCNCDHCHHEDCEGGCEGHHHHGDGCGCGHCH